MKNIILFMLVVVFTQNNCSQTATTNFSKDNTKLRDSLKQDSEFVQLSCGMGNSEETIKSESEIKLKAYQNFGNKEGTSKIKMMCKTTEGDPLYSYLTIQKGNASVLIDTSEDKNGNKEITLYKCRNLEIGKFSLDEKTQELIFQPLKNNELKEQKELSLRCLSGNEKIIF